MTFFFQLDVIYQFDCFLWSTYLNKSLKRGQSPLTFCLMITTKPRCSLMEHKDHLTEQQHQTRSLWDDDKMRQRRSFCNTQNTKLLVPKPLTKHECYFLKKNNYSFIFALVRSLYRWVGSGCPVSIPPAYWQHPKPHFLRPPPKWLSQEPNPVTECPIISIFLQLQ